MNYISPGSIARAVESFQETGDDAELARLTAALRSSTSQQAFDVMRAAGTDFDPAEKLVALALSQKVITVQDAADIMESYSAEPRGAHP